MVESCSDDGIPDWRDAAAYPFERLDRPGFAWEWLRRDSGYRQTALTARNGDPGAPDTDAASWGLVMFENPAQPAPLARPMWQAAWDRQVLQADAVACAAHHADSLLIEQLGDLATVVRIGTIEHLLLTDGWRRVRVDICSGTLHAGPVLLRWRLAGIRSTAPRTRALRRFRSVIATGRFPNRYWERDPRTHRWTLALRAHDALRAGASQRDIAEALIAREPLEPGWRAKTPSVRLRAQRLAVLARALRGRGFAERYLR